MKIDEKNMSEIMQRLWEYSKRHPMRFNDLAKKIGVTRQALARLLTTNVEPNFEIRCKIEKFLSKEQEKN